MQTNPTTTQNDSDNSTLIMLPSLTQKGGTMPDINAYDYKVHGHDNQLLELVLQPGESVNTENGSMCFMSEGVRMSTGFGKKRNLASVFKRKISGENIFINVFENQSREPAQVGLAPKLPSVITPVYLNSSSPDIICQPSTFLAGHPEVRVSVAFNSARNLIAGQGGLVMQRLHGLGQAFLDINGSMAALDLARGETWQAERAAIAAFEESVEYEATTVRGMTNMMFGGEGLFILRLTGPGKVWIQSPNQQDKQTTTQK